MEKLPKRWIKCLASADSLLKLVLARDEELVCSGNDLRYFYYLFAASQSKSRRNVLVRSLHWSEVCHLHAFKQEHHGELMLYGAFATLAMGYG